MSDQINYQILGNEIINVQEGTNKEVYAIRKKELRCGFVAPQNGLSMFETSGDIPNRFAAEDCNISDKEDNINQTLMVILKRGENSITALQTLCQRTIYCV